MPPYETDEELTVLDALRTPLSRQANHTASRGERNMPVLVHRFETGDSLFAGWSIRPYQPVSSSC